MDKALKQRLVGASVLIIFMIIVLPMLLSGRSDTLKQESRQIELPPKPEELSFETRRFPVGPSAKPPAPVRQNSASAELDLETVSGEGPDASGLAKADIEGGAVTTADMTAAASGDSLAGGTAQPGAVEAKPPAVTSIKLSSGKPRALDPIDTTDESVDMPRYLVQVASFSSEKNANALAAHLRADNLPVVMDVVDRVAGRLHRVRVGPYAERSQADAVVAALGSKSSDLTPRVLDQRPDDSAPVSTPSDPLVRWVVQVGSFSSSKSAESLVAELRLGGLSAFSEKVTSAGGEVHKVRIGPELDRDKATELARKVKIEHDLDAFVTTQE